MPLLPYLTKLGHKSSNTPSILSLTTRSFASLSRNLNVLPDKPTSAYYDNLVKTAAHERDFNTLRYLLNKRLRDGCFNTTNTFKFITRTAASLSVIDDVVQALARLDSGYPRKNAYDSLIARLCKIECVDEALRIVDVMARGEYELSAVSFHPILMSITRKKKMEDAWSVVELMKAHAVSPDLTAYNFLLTSYCFMGDLAGVNAVMKRINEDGLGADSRTYDALVLGACRAGKLEGALVVLRRMEEDGVPVLYSTHMHVINGLVKLGYYSQAIKFVIIYGGREIGLDREAFGYLARKLMKLKRFEEAKLVFSEMERRGLVMSQELRDRYNFNYD